MMKSQLRVAFDLDGVLADFASAYNQIAEGLFPDWSGSEAVPSEVPPDKDPAAAEQGSDPLRRLSRRDRDAIWKQLRSTPDFWLTLDPIDPEAIPLLQERSSHLGWDMFFVTQRPPTVGGSVQSQTQRWLVEHGFELPSVIVHSGSRGRLAAALELDHLVDDTIQHCVDTLSASEATPILVSAEPDEIVETNARQLGIDICTGPRESLELIERGAARRRFRSLMRRGR